MGKRMTDGDERRLRGLLGRPPSQPGRALSFDDMTEEEVTNVSTPVAALGTGGASIPRGRDRAALTVVAGAQPGVMFTLGSVSVVGRGRACAIRIDEPIISREHARVRRVGSAYLIDDLGSRNGTFVNGAPVKTQELAEGDRVSFGSQTVLRFGFTDEQEEVMLRGLYESSVLDGLTGAFNRKHFSERLVGEVAYARRHGAPLSLLMFDLDHFKRINDTLGHLGGDHVLRRVASLIKRTLRAEDIFSRYGGEEFVIIARGTDLEHAFLFAERLRIVIASAKIEFEGREVSLTISAGVASLSCIPPEGTLDDLVGLADKRLYAAKAAGRNLTVGDPG
jgi:two-component system cell cycle response regulator